jgi:hypothetical protein
MGERNTIQDNRYQVYTMYLWSMFFTLCLIGASFLTYYQPTISLNFQALEYLNEHKAHIFGQVFRVLSSSRAKMPGSTVSTFSQQPTLWANRTLSSLGWSHVTR